MSAPNNHKNHLLATLAHSTNKYVQFATLALIAATGIGNWLATLKSASTTQNEIEINRSNATQAEQRIKAELVAQVADIHAWLSAATQEFHAGNADSAANRKTLEALKTKIDDISQKLDELR
jgi:hypothetical protein